jgi:hypothetical protein
MQRKRNNKRIITVFRSYYRNQVLNRFIKNLMVYIPAIEPQAVSIRSRLSNLSAPLVALLSNKDKSLSHRLSIIDLDLLNERLAVHLKAPLARTISLSEQHAFKYENIDLETILAKQGELLQELIAAQRNILNQQAQQILQKEQERLKTKYKNNAGARRRKK